MSPVPGLIRNHPPVCTMPVSALFQLTRHQPPFWNDISLHYVGSLAVLYSETFWTNGTVVRFLAQLLELWGQLPAFIEVLPASTGNSAGLAAMPPASRRPCWSCWKASNLRSQRLLASIWKADSLKTKGFQPPAWTVYSSIQLVVLRASTSNSANLSKIAGGKVAQKKAR